MGKTNRNAKKAGDSATGELPNAAVQSAARKIGRRLILKFVGEDKPELDRIEFRFKESTAPVFWQRGDDNHGFVWTEVPQAFSILFLDYLWSASLKSSEPFFFRGAKNGSHAASLGDAIHQPKHRIHELFIETFPSGGTTNCVRRVFNGDNLHGKANRERRVSVKSDFLPPDCVEVFWGERGPLVESGDVQLLVNRIRESLGLATARIEQLPGLGVDTSESLSRTPTTPGPQQPIGDVFAASQPQPLPAPTEDKIPDDIKCLFDEGGKLTDEGRYAQAREKFALAKQAAETQRCSSALMKARIDICETQILEQQDIALARDDLLACLRELPADAESDHRQGVLCLLGDSELIIGSLLEAKSLYREAHLIARGRKDRFAEARYLIGLSHTEELLGNLKEANSLLDEATELYRAEYRETTGEKKRRTAINLGASFSTKAKFLRHEAKLTEALACLARAEPLFRDAGNLDNVGRTLVSKAEILFNEANTEDGFAALKEALSIFESIGNVVWQCRCLDDMAKFLFQSRNESRALACLERALYLVNSERPDVESVPFLLKCAHLCRDHDQADRAKAFIQRAKEIAANAKDSCLVAECLVAEAGDFKGDDGQAAREALFKSAVKHVESALPNCEVKGRRVQYMQKLGDLYGWLRNAHEARAWFERSLHESEEIGDVIGMGHSLASLAAAAREEKSPADAIAALERLVAFCEGKPLHYDRAAALHDLGYAKLCQGEITGAERCLEEAKMVAEKHGFKDVLEKLKLSQEQLEHARSIRQPPHRDFPCLIRELHDWCKRYPKFSKGILPVWYYFHRAELWSICRSMLGVKFLICAEDSAAFRRVAGTLRAQGDLFGWGINIALKTKPQTEMIPFPMDFFVPRHLKTAFFKQLPKDTEQAARAIANTLEHNPYVMLPFTDDVKSRHGTCLYVYGMHVRLAPLIYKMMLDTPADDLIADSKICLPLSQHDEAPGLMEIMHVAWENGLIPIFSERLPHHERIKSECDSVLDTPNSAIMTSVSESVGSVAKELWVKLLSSCQQTPQASLSEFHKGMTALVAKHAPESAMRARVYLLRFQAGEREVVHPAAVLVSPCACLQDKL